MDENLRDRRAHGAVPFSRSQNCPTVRTLDSVLPTEAAISWRRVIVMTRLQAAICGAISALMTGTCYATSAEMAEELGPFPGFEANRDPMLKVMRNHRRAAQGAVDGYEKLSVLPVPLKPKKTRIPTWPRRRSAPGTGHSTAAKLMAIATRRCL